MKVHIATIRVQESTTWICSTRERAEKRVADWCREQWPDVFEEDKPIPETDREILAAYFTPDEDGYMDEEFIIKEITVDSDEYI